MAGFMEEYIYRHEMKVRDYECDVQGVVNNANYQHYLEHAPSSRVCRYILP